MFSRDIDITKVIVTYLFLIFIYLIKNKSLRALSLVSQTLLGPLFWKPRQLFWFDCRASGFTALLWRFWKVSNGYIFLRLCLICSWNTHRRDFSLVWTYFKVVALKWDRYTSWPMRRSVKVKAEDLSVFSVSEVKVGFISCLFCQHRMKLRVRISRQTCRLELQGDEPSLAELRARVRDSLLTRFGLRSVWAPALAHGDWTHTHTHTVNAAQKYISTTIIQLRALKQWLSSDFYSVISINRCCFIVKLIIIIMVLIFFYLMTLILYNHTFIENTMSNLMP